MPSRNTIHIDTLLSNVSVKYMPTEYIADKVFPTVSVKKTTDKYRTYTRNWRLQETERADKAMAREADFAVTTSSYILKRHALKSYISDNEIENYDAADLRADTTENLTDNILRRKEYEVATIIGTSTNWSLNVSLAATAAWSSNSAGSDPCPVVWTGASTVIANSGYTPNFMVLPRESYLAVKKHVSILDRVKYTSADMTKDVIARLFEVDEVLIPNANYDSSREGLTDSLASIWTQNYVFMGYKPATPGPLKPSCGYVFEKARPLVRRWRDEDRDAEAIEVNREYQPKVVASLAAYLIIDSI